MATVTKRTVKRAAAEKARKIKDPVQAELAAMLKGSSSKGKITPRGKVSAETKAAAAKETKASKAASQLATIKSSASINKAFAFRASEAAKPESMMAFVDMLMIGIREADVGAMDSKTIEYLVQREKEVRIKARRDKLDGDAARDDVSASQFRGVLKLTGMTGGWTVWLWVRKNFATWVYARDVANRIRNNAMKKGAPSAEVMAKQARIVMRQRKGGDGERKFSVGSLLPMMLRQVAGLRATLASKRGTGDHVKRIDSALRILAGMAKGDEALSKLSVTVAGAPKAKKAKKAAKKKAA